MADSSEIVITHEFSFEDIPEGIPLEDPMYENLTKENKNKDQETVDIKYVLHNETKDLNASYHIGDEVSIELDTADIVTNKTTELTEIDRTVSDKSKILNDTVNKAEPGNKYRRKQKKVTTISDKLSNIDASHEVKEISSTRKGKASIESFHHENEIPRTVESENEILTEPIQQETTVGNVVTEANDEQTEHTFQEKVVENPNLSSFHVIDSEKDLEVPSGLEGPVPAMLLPPPSFQPRSYSSVVPTGIVL